MSETDFKELIAAKTSMKFSGDDFVKNDAAYPNSSFVELESDVDSHFGIGKPIGEIMTMVDVNEITDKILAGAQLNDDDDQAETLESLKSAERVSGANMGTPEFTEKNFKKSGNLSQDFLADDNRIYTKYLSDAFTDKDTE